MIYRLFGFILAGILCLAVTAPAHAFTCGGSIISEGLTKIEVLMKCGEPASRNSREEQISEKVDNTTRIKTTVGVEEWIYNFGPQSFLQILTFRDGKLVAINSGGYGYPDTKGQPALCDEQKVHVGDTALDVTMECGEPTMKDGRKEEIIEDTGVGLKRKTTVNVEEWTYNFGPNRFMRIFTFRNGRLIDIKTGSYGK